MKKNLSIFLLIIILISYFSCDIKAVNLTTNKLKKFENFLKNLQSNENIQDVNNKLQETLNTENNGNDDDEEKLIKKNREELKTSFDNKEENQENKTDFSRFRFTSTDSTTEKEKLMARNLSEEKMNTELITKMKPIKQGWMTVQSDYFKSNNNIPILNVEEGQVKFEIDGDFKLLNPNFQRSEANLKAKIYKNSFYGRLNNGYLYFTLNDKSLEIIFTLSIRRLAGIKNLYDENGCFEVDMLEVKNGENSTFTFCTGNSSDASQYTCIFTSLVGKVDYKPCLTKLKMAVIKPKKIKKKILKQPFMVIPTPQRVCNQGWNFENNGNDWECLCKEGKRQSPIDLPNTTDAVQTPVKPLFEYDQVNEAKSEKLKISYDGGELKILADTNELINGKGFGRVVTPDGAVYHAEKINFKTPSEHTINGKQFPMEIQVIHYAKTKGDFGKSVYVSFLLTGKAGIYNRFIDDIEFFNLPNPHEKQRILHNRLFIPNVLLNSDDQEISIMRNFSFYTYQGSSTEPPCNENVIHYVASTPIPCSITALDMFKEALRMPDFEDQEGNIIVSEELPMKNNRDVQDLYGRPVFFYDTDVFSPPLFIKADDRGERVGHYEKKKARVTNYFFVDGYSSSEIPGATVVSEEEALS